MTTLPSDLVGGIERLLRPLSAVGIPSQELAVMIAMALRFMPMLLEEYDRLRMAQMARGADFSTGSLALRTRAVTALAIPLLLSAFRRADELALAMEARGYRRGPRTTLRELRLSGWDLAAFAVMAVFVTHEHRTEGDCMNRRWTLIDTPAQLAKAEKPIRAAGIIALDTEYDSFRYFRDKLCLIQVQTEEKTWLIDPAGRPRPLLSRRGPDRSGRSSRSSTPATTTSAS